MKNGDHVIEISDAERSDLSEILALQKTAFQPEAALYDDYTVPPLTQTLEDINAEFGAKAFLKAVDGGRIVGSVRAHECDGVCHIARLFVEPARQKQGIASRLMAAIEARFPSARRFELFTGHRNEANLRFYQKRGYVEFKRECFSDRLHMVFMAKANAAAVV